MFFLVLELSVREKMDKICLSKRQKLLEKNVLEMLLKSTFRKK